MQQLEQLKRNSLRLYDGLPILWPRVSTPGKFNVKSTIKRIKTHRAYNVKNGIVSFVDFGEMFVTPVETAPEILEKYGFEKVDDLHVPFSSGDLPQGETLKEWEKLIRFAA